MISVRHPIALLLCGIGLISIGCSQTPIASESTQVSTPAGTTQSQPLRQPDVVYVPTPPEVVDRMLAIAKVNRNDVLYDLGSGDGRIPITAAQKFGIRATGIDINPQRIKEANANAKQAGVTDRVRFLNQDLFQSKFGNATVVTLYLLPALNVKLRPQLLSQLKPGTRIVSHAFDMGEWKPEQTAQVQVNGQTHNVYLWTVPEKPPANLLSTVIADRISRDRIAN
jgi:predicted O-methyltransferase YrrM